MPYEVSECFPAGKNKQKVKQFGETLQKFLLGRIIVLILRLHIASESDMGKGVGIAATVVCDGVTFY